MADLPLSKFLKVVERNCLVEALETCKTAKDAAAELGIKYENLRKKARAHGLKLTAFHKQRGFIFGGVYVYLAIAVGLAIALALAFNGGRKYERADWLDQQNSDLRTANQAIDAAHKKAREQEAQSAQKVAAVSTAYQKDLANANRAKDLALNALRAGGLRVAVTGCQATDGGTGQAAPAAPGRDGGAATGFLAENDAAFLLSEASRADEVTLQLRACQAVIRADRS
jgi:hypothetical protein